MPLGRLEVRDPHTSGSPNGIGTQYASHDHLFDARGFSSAPGYVSLLMRARFQRPKKNCGYRAKCSRKKQTQVLDFTQNLAGNCAKTGCEIRNAPQKRDVASCRLSRGTLGSTIYWQFPLLPFNTPACSFRHTGSSRAMHPLLFHRRGGIPRVSKQNSTAIGRVEICRNPSAAGKPQQCDRRYATHRNGEGGCCVIHRLCGKPQQAFAKSAGTRVDHHSISETGGTDQT